MLDEFSKLRPCLTEITQISHYIVGFLAADIVLTAQMNFSLIASFERRFELSMPFERSSGA